MKDDLLYGFEGDEVLTATDPADVVTDWLANGAAIGKEDFERFADTIKWPLRIHEYKRGELREGTAVDLAEQALEDALEWLDDTYRGAGYSLPTTEPTELMKEAAKAFGERVVKDYVPWACEPTGEVIEYTRDQVREITEAE